MAKIERVTSDQMYYNELKSDDLTNKLEGIEKFLSDNQFSIFTAQHFSHGKLIPQASWDMEENWENFFEVAKKEGISTIVLEKGNLEEEDVDDIKISLEDSDLPEQIIEKCKPLISELEKNQNKLAFFTFSWIKNGIEYSLSEKTKWYSEFENSLHLIAKAEQLAEPRRTGMIYEEKELPKEIENKSAEELANELWDFMLKEYPNAGLRERYSIEKTFWMKKGVYRYDSIKANLLIDKVSSIILRKIDESEKEKIPDTVEKCINWLKKYQMKKLTKTDLNGFLAENSLDLSTTNRSIIHSRVNLKLKKLE